MFVSSMKIMSKCMAQRVRVLHNPNFQRYAVVCLVYMCLDRSYSASVSTAREGFWGQSLKALQSHNNSWLWILWVSVFQTVFLRALWWTGRGIASDTAKERPGWAWCWAPSLGHIQAGLLLSLSHIVLLHKIFIWRKGSALSKNLNLK